MRKTVTQVYEDIQERKKNVDFIPTGFMSLDNHMDGGFLKGEVIILGGRTGSGKSFMSANVFYNVATAGFSSAYFSLEISNNMILSRLIGAKANVQPTSVMMKELDEKTEEKIFEAKADIAVYEPFMAFYDDLYTYAAIQKEIVEHKYEFVVIDFIQNISVTGKEEYERLSYLAHAFQQLAREQNVCILIVSQLSNSIAKEKRDDIVEYKGSGEIGVVCDVGLYIEAGRSGDGSFSVRVRKNRRGVTGTSYGFFMDAPSARIREDSI